MGDVSIIARRLESGKYVQYGHSGNGGYFRVVGDRLLCWYDDPEMVEYLFDLGQMSLIGKPYSEKGGAPFVFTNHPEHMPHYLGTSERQIFSKIAFIDYGYFYDLDETWYYIIPGPFRIKMPLDLIANHLDDKGYESDYLDSIEKMLLKYLLETYYEGNKKFRDYFSENERMDVNELRVTLLDTESPTDELFDHHYKIFSYFDDWVVAKTDDEHKEVTGFIVREKFTEHIETYLWTN